MNTCQGCAEPLGALDSTRNIHGVRWHTSCWERYTKSHPIMPSTNVQSVLQEAHEIINGERQKTYGPPRQSFERIGELWGPILGVKNISAAQVALCLIQLKVSRAIGGLEHSGGITRDTVVDIAGYAGCIELFGEV